MTNASQSTTELATLVDKLEVTDTQKEYLRTRWLDQILWMDKKANDARARHHIARTIILLGSVFVPVMVSLPNFCDGDAFRNITIAASLTVATTAGIEALFHFGDKWRHYRANVETLKTEGWLFSLAAGPYKRFKQQSEAFPSFAERIEQLLQRDVSEYLELLGGSSEAHVNPMRVG